MLSFLLLVSSSGAPLEPAHFARLGRWVGPSLAHEPETMRVWRSDEGRVGFVGWQSRPDLRGGSHWHVGGQGLTAFTGSPWLHRGWPDGPSWALDLTSRLDPIDPAGLPHLAGAWTAVRVAPDGTGWVATDPLGAGAVHVARGDGVVAVSDRAGVAASALGGGARACDLASLLGAGVQAAGSGWEATRTVPPDRWLRLAPEPGLEPASRDRLPVPGDEVAMAADGLGQLVEAVAAWGEGPAVVDLDAGPGAALVAAAVRASGTTGRFRFRATGSSADRAAAERIAAVLGVSLEPGPSSPGPAGPAALDAWVRRVVARTEATVLPPLVAAVEPPGARVVVRSVAWGRAHRARLAGAEEALLGGALRVDPMSVVTEPADGQEEAAATALLRTLDPGGDLALTRDQGTDPGPGWEHVGPLLAARATATSLPDDAPDLPDLLGRLRAGERSAEVQRQAWATLVAVTWLARLERPSPLPRRAPTRPSRSAATGEAPTLVSGLTSRSLPELLDLRVPLDDRRHDALLGTDVDGAVAELCARILLSVDATEVDLPDDLVDRLASPETAPFAPVARDLLARRGGILADARLGLLLPFWTAHVHPSPRVVLVDERPAELLACSSSPLPPDVLLGLWLDIAVGALLGHEDARVVDPRDVGHVEAPEGIAPPDGAQSDALRLASVLDALVRELDGDEIAPLLGQMSAARSARGRGLEAPAADGGALLDTLGEAWRRAGHGLAEARRAAGETAALAARVAELEDELAALRVRPGVRLALRLSGGRAPRR